MTPNACAPYVSDDGNNPPDPITPVTCICDPGLQVPNLSGRLSGSKYNDRYLEIQVPITTDLAALTANGGWYKVEYVFNNSVSDRTTWSVSLPGAAQTSSSTRTPTTHQRRYQFRGPIREWEF